MKYISTRGPGQPKDFTDVLLAGMAPDGGLYIPDSWPELDGPLLGHLSGLPYASVAAQILKPFVGSAIEQDKLQELVDDTYRKGVFHHPAMAPLKQIGPNAWLMELFHGPTLSFKDYALQLLGRLFDHMLEEKGERLTIIGATSGDTGSAAIEACRHCKNIDIFILYPQGRTSDIQRRQMTTVDAENVHTLAVNGTFDDCQALVKAMFADEAMRKDLNLSAVNSINWARIMAQIVYYVTAGLALGAPQRPVSFAVPTGNFGNIYAAWCARQIGLPIHKLVIGTNQNDILTRFFHSGQMETGDVKPSLSPSMDIQVSSNFERYLCDLLDRDHKALKELMEQFQEQKSFELNREHFQQAQATFTAERCDDRATLETIRECYSQTGYIIDPHTAVALHAASVAMETDPAVPMVVLGCAHPAKFPDAIEAAIGRKPEIPERMAAVMDKAEHFTPLPHDLDKVKSFISQTASRR